MSILQAIILGVIQGVTEFLPVSSSGHLVLFQHIFGVNQSLLTFDACVHLGTLVAVFMFFKNDIISILKKPFQKITWLLLVGTIPTAIIGLAFKDFFEQVFHNGSTLGFGFFITGIILLLSQQMQVGKKDVSNAKYRDALFVGLMQGAAILPAISRSGLTVSAAFMRGFDKDFAAKFSFLLSIPAILGATLIQVKSLVEVGGENTDLTVLMVGGASAAIAGYISIKYFIEILKKGKLKYFSYYVFAVGSFVVIDQLFTHFIFK